jgi:phosphatidylinositol alpha-1,6-mannosyltransferase
MNRPSKDEESGRVVRRTPIPRTLVVTNDFPPRVGGVQQYVWNVVSNLPMKRIAVLAPSWPGWREHDAEAMFPVHRWPASFQWPTEDLRRRISSLIREHDADVVLFGHGCPLPLLGPALARRGTPYVVLTHGAEVWLARTPAVAASMRVAFGRAAAVTAVSQWTAQALQRVAPPNRPIAVLYPGVDAERFSPAVDGSPLRERLGLTNARVVVCVSRLVPRKGQDVLIAAMSLIRPLVPEAVLLIVGDGPYRRRLRAAAAEAPEGSVVFTGEVDPRDLAGYYAAGDVFAMPCRSRWGGLEVEGFGIVFLEAAATGKPAVAGRSGGAGEAIVDGVSGVLVEGREPKAVALAIAGLLRDPGATARMGAAGRARIEEGFTWPKRAQQLAGILREAVR